MPAASLFLEHAVYFLLQPLLVVWYVRGSGGLVTACVCVRVCVFVVCVCVCVCLLCVCGYVEGGRGVIYIN